MCRSCWRWAWRVCSAPARRCRRSSPFFANRVSRVMLEALLERFYRRDRLALARLLTLMSRGERVEEILGNLQRPTERGHVVAITGSGGVGKSTLIGKLIEHIRGQGQT